MKLFYRTPTDPSERVFIVALALIGILRGLIETLSLGYLSTTLYTDFLFSRLADKLRE
jgi:hypothetical protein